MQDQIVGQRSLEYRKPNKTKKFHNETIRRYRLHKQQSMKRIEVWIKRPQDLDLLKRYSELNQTNVINQLIEIVAKGLNEEEEYYKKHKEQNIDEMIAHLMETFEKFSRF